MTKERGISLLLRRTAAFLLAGMLLSGCTDCGDPLSLSDGTGSTAETPESSEPETSALTAPVWPAEPETETISLPETEHADETVTAAAETEPPVPASVRIAMPKFRGQMLAEIAPLLEENGLSYETEEVYDPLPAGTICGVRFHGVISETAYEIHPAYPVELKVSLGRRAHYNVQAPDEKTIYLTFDDGPSPYTETVLEILASYDVRATFFMVGQFIGYYPEEAKAVADAGHVIACHSETHDYQKLYTSAEAVEAEIASWETEIEKAVGFVPEPKLFRFPGGSNMNLLSPALLDEIYWSLHEQGFRCFDWTCANCDRLLYQKPEEQTTEEYLKTSALETLALISVNPRIPKIMLMHDTEEETVGMLPWLLSYLTEEGYSFGTLDELDGDWMFLP